jgi:hypothetical protein
MSTNVLHGQFKPQVIQLHPGQVVDTTHAKYLLPSIANAPRGQHIVGDVPITLWSWALEMNLKQPYQQAVHHVNACVTVDQ